MMIPYQTVHFVGVLTPEMTGLAVYTSSLGCKVTASDDHQDGHYLAALLREGVTFSDMFAQLNVSKTTELVVLSRYYDTRHTEAEAALRLKIPVVTETDYTKLLSEGIARVAVLGDYDARFLAALLAHTWQRGHMPIRAITNTVTEDNQALVMHAADPDWFILPLSGFKRDASTYEAGFLSFEAEQVIIPSMLYDYPELNTTLDDVYQSYYAFVKRVPRKGLIIGNADYSRMKRLRSHLADRRIETYGFDRDASWQIRDIAREDGMSSFSLLHERQMYGPFTLPYLSSHAISAAAAVCIASLYQDMKPTTLGDALKTAPQLKRYFEIKRDREGRLIIDDQSDHPEAIRNVLQTIRECYPEKKIWCLYQPGSFLRTKALASELQSALSLAHFVYLTDIKGYPKEKSEGLHIRHFIADMKRQHAQTYYFDDAVDMTGLLGDRVASTDCIVTLGVDGICQQIVAPLLVVTEE